MRRAVLGVGASLLALGAMAGSGHAQAAVAETGFYTVSVGDARLTELVVPFGVTWRFPRVRVDVSSAWAAALYEHETTSSQLSGLTDVTVRLTVPMLEDRARVIVAGNVPTGAETLRSSQLPVAAALTTDLLALPVRSFGSGAGVTGGLALARPVGDWVAGGIAVYRVGSAYEPVVAGPGGQATEFRPGSELRLRLALERPRVSGTSIRLASSWSRFGRDQTENEAIFSRGDRFMAEAMAELPILTGTATVSAWHLYRSGSQILVGPEPQAIPSSTLLGVGAGGAYPLSRVVTLRPRLELTVQRGEEGLAGGSGWITRVGTGVSYRIASFRVEPAALLQLGALNDEAVIGVLLRAGVLWGR